jgi:hypothetical protein
MPQPSMKAAMFSIFFGFCKESCLKGISNFFQAFIFKSALFVQRPKVLYIYLLTENQIQIFGLLA